MRSCESLFAGTVTGCDGLLADDATDVVGVCEGIATGEAVVPAVAGPVTAGRLECAGWTGGLGPKYLAHRIITPKERSEATRIRSSGVNLSFCPGALMSAPQISKLSLRLHSLASLPISPEPDRNQIFARAAGSAASA